MLLRDQFSTGNQGVLRQQNLSGIMHHLYEKAPISRIALARLTGLNKTTVSSLISELLDNRFVIEIGNGAAKGSGRRTVLLDINPARGCIVSAEVGADFISVICANFAAEIIWRHREGHAITARREVILKRAVRILQKAVAAGTAEGAALLGLSLAVPGLVDRESGTLLFAPNLGWSDVPLKAMLAQSFQTMILVENEATQAALGEQYFGVAEGCDEVLYISAGVGLGGGLVLGGRIYSGSAGFASEFGHMTMEPDGELCSCGNRGCWETQVSQAALFRNIRQAIAKGAASRLKTMIRKNAGQLTVEMVVAAARGNDAVALKALRKVGRHLGIGIASLINALNPRLVVFGGILSLAGDFLLPVVNEELQHRALRWNQAAVRVVIAKYGSDASVMGGIAKVCQAVLTNPLLASPAATK